MSQTTRLNRRLNPTCYSIPIDEQNTQEENLVNSQIADIFKASKRKVGRPTRLDEAMMVNLEILASIGLSYRAMAESVGCSYSLLQRWLIQSEELRFRVGIAKNKGKARIVRQILAHGERNWQALAWLLERMHKDEFALRSFKVDISDGDEGVNLEDVDFSQFTDEELLVIRTAGLKIKSQKQGSSEDAS